VSLCYGRSPSYPAGRYFACWEEVSTYYPPYGRIYTSHTEPNFNSPFTFPYRLDVLDPYGEGYSRNPSIACQYNNIDNQNAKMTEVILFESPGSSFQHNDIIGIYNTDATRSVPSINDFNAFSFTNTTNNNLYPDVSFNPYNSTFMVTYFDSTNQKLPFLAKDLNLTNPNSWNIINTGYNDSPSITFPYPKVNINYDKQDGMNAWIADGGTGQGKAMFDAPYSTYIGTSEIISSEGTKLFGAFPNPCTSSVTIGFGLQQLGKVTISINSITGQLLKSVTDQVYTQGRHNVKADISGLSPGIYLYTFKSGEFIASGKIVVVR